MNKHIRQRGGPCRALLFGLLLVAVGSQAAGVVPLVTWQCEGGDQAPYVVRCIVQSVAAARDEPGPDRASAGVAQALVPVAMRDDFVAAPGDTWSVPLYAAPADPARVHGLLQDVLCGERADCAVVQAAPVTRLGALP